MAYQLMDEGRFFVAPVCLWLIEALEKCPLGAARYGGKKPFGKYSHVCDAIFYPVWRLEEKAGHPRGPIDPRLIVPLDPRPRGRGFL
jgi:hypothetical protein